MAQAEVGQNDPILALRDAVTIGHPELRHSVQNRTRKRSLRPL